MSTKAKNGNRGTTSESGKTPKPLPGSTLSLTDGAEPTGLLLALLSSPLLTLWVRGAVTIKTGELEGVPTVAVLFSNTTFDPQSGVKEIEK